MLAVRIALQGGWSLGVSLRYESTNRDQKFSKSTNFSTFLKTSFLQVSRLWDEFWQKNFLTKKLFKVPVLQRDPKGRNSPLHVIREGRLSLFRSHGKGAGAWASHCDTRIQIEVKNILSHKIFQIFSKQVFFMFQDYGISFGKKKFLTKKIALSPSIATRSQRQKLPFACYQRRRNLPVRIALQGGWSLCVSLRCESKNRGQKFSKSTNFSTFLKTGFLQVSRLWDGFWQKNFLAKKNVQSPSIATRSQRQKLPFACYQRRATLPVQIAWQGCRSLGVSLRYESTNRSQKYSKS